MKVLSRKEFNGEFKIPGDKSITHRAVMFNSFAEGKSKITNALLGEDCLATIDCMQTLGAKITVENDTVFVEGVNKLNNNVLLDCKNSGTSIRLLMGLVCGKNISASLTGDDSLCNRPMMRVVGPLTKMGASIQTTDGKAPVNILPTKLKGIDYEMEVASAQVKSAILIAGMFADGETVVREKIKTRNHTELMLSAMGANIQVTGNDVRIRKSKLISVDVAVPSDISSASYFMALGLLMGKTTCFNVGINSTRAGILKVFDAMGAVYEKVNEKIICGEMVADIICYKSDLKAVTLTADIMPSLIDELPLIAVLCAYADGKSVISGAEELKYKESDRIKTTCEMLNAIGADATPTDDGFIIVGKKTLDGGKINSYLDHRIAMSGAVALLNSLGGGEIEGAECVNISFPDFYQKVGLLK